MVHLSLLLGLPTPTWAVDLMPHPMPDVAATMDPALCSIGFELFTRRCHKASGQVWPMGWKDLCRRQSWVNTVETYLGTPESPEFRTHFGLCAAGTFCLDLPASSSEQRQMHIACVSVDVLLRELQRREQQAITPLSAGLHPSTSTGPNLVPVIGLQQSKQYDFFQHEFTGAGPRVRQRLPDCRDAAVQRQGQASCYRRCA